MLLCNETSFTPGTCSTHWRYVKWLILQDLPQLPSLTAPWLETQKESKPSDSYQPRQTEESFRSGKAYCYTNLSASCWAAPLLHHHPCSQPPACPVVACCKVKGQQNHPFQQPSIHHVKLHPQHAQHEINFLYGISRVIQAGFPIRGGGRMSWGKNWCQGKY